MLAAEAAASRLGAEAGKRSANLKKGEGCDASPRRLRERGGGDRIPRYADIAIPLRFSLNLFLFIFWVLGGERGLGETGKKSKAAAGSYSLS